MPRPTFDLESYSEAGFVWTDPNDKYPLGRWVAPRGAKQLGISAVGSAVYAEHPSTEVLCASYDLADGHGVRRWLPGQPMPADLRAHVEAGGTLEFHKADFEVGMWAAQLVTKHGWIPLPAGAARCSMAKAHVAQYPGALGNLGAVLGLETEKDKDGKRLIAKFCVPQQPILGLVDRKTGRVKREPVSARRIYPYDDPEDFERLCAYCDTDVISQMQASDAMPDMEPHEVIAWQLDQQMNHRGLAVDRVGLRACIDILDQVIAQYGAECRALTGFDATQLEKLKGWLAAYGVHTASLDSDAIDALLARDDLPAPARRVLELRALTGSASVKKTYAMEAQCSDDNRLRHLVIHHGTRPGRPTGSGPQPLNLPKAGPALVACECGRPHTPAALICPWCGEIGAPGRKAKWAPWMVDHVLEIMECGSLAMVEQFFGDAMLAISGCLRGLFVAGPGHELVSTDYSSLQAVVAACLAGEQWRIDAFKRGDPIYLLGASKITGTPLSAYLDYYEQHGDHHPDRQKIGKVSELACLGAETLVWTRRPGKGFRQRWKRIVDVAADDLVFDGVRWVAHGGLIKRGERMVEYHAGIIATPDHKFLVGRTWQRFDAMNYSRWSKAASNAWSLFIMPAMMTTPSPATTQKVYDLANCGPRNRFVIATDYGPVLAHNCGFQGWINSYKAFGSTEPDNVIRKQILAWREASPAIVEMWGGQWRGPPWRRERHELYGLEGMFIAAVQNPGQTFTYRGVSFCMEDGQDCLVIRLPQIDGIRRPLRYHEPRLAVSDRNTDELSISYMTWNSNPNYGRMGWVRMGTWGGRLFENVVMGVEVDIQRYGVKLLAKHGYPMVLGVYDEDVVEIPMGKPLTLGLPPVEGLDPYVQEVEHLLGIMPPELADWPIRASGGWRGRRYRKG